MAYNFLACDRGQAFLLPPDLRDWLPQDHLAWFILDVVDHVDLEPFLRSYRTDGHGHPAYDPKTLLGVLLYGYCLGVRSSRQIERRCTEDVAFRVLAANQTPDHVTIARFRARHEQALAGFLVESLKLCAAAGLVRLGVVALDGTKVAANAASRANRTLAKLEEEVAEILREAAEADQAEDHQHGPARGDELPVEFASPSGRLARLRTAKARLEAEAAERQRRYQQRVAELAAAARAKGKQPRAPIKARRRDEAPKLEAVANVTNPRQPPSTHPQRLGTGLHRPSGRHLRAGDRRGRAHPAHQRPATAATDAGRHHRDPSGRRDLGAARDPAGRLRLLVDRQPDRDPGCTGVVDSAGQARPPGQAPQGRQAVGVTQRRTPRRHAGQAGQRRRQGPVRAAPADHRAGLRPDQGRPRGAAVPAPRAGRVCGGVEAAVRHQQPAQALAV
jgi:transposase